MTCSVSFLKIFWYTFFNLLQAHEKFSLWKRVLLFLKHGVGQNIATYAPPAFRNFFLVLISTFPGLPIFHTLVGILSCSLKRDFHHLQNICFVCVYCLFQCSYFYFGKLCVMAPYFYVTPTWLRASNLESEKSGLNKHSEGCCYRSLTTWAQYCLAPTAFWWSPWWCVFYVLLVLNAEGSLNPVIVGAWLDHFCVNTICCAASSVQQCFALRGHLGLFVSLKNWWLSSPARVIFNGYFHPILIILKSKIFHLWD